MSINNVTLVGRITKDLELKYTPSGMAFCKFTLAVNRQFKKEGQPDADFIPVTVFNKQAENLANYMGKGSMIGVTGQIQTGSYTNSENQKVFTTDVIAQSVQFLDSKKDNNQQQGQAQPQQQQYQQPMQQQFQQQPQFTQQQPQYQQMSTTHLAPMNPQQGQQFAQQMGAQVVNDSDLPF